MKSKIAIIVLSVILALTILASVGLCIYLPYRATHVPELYSMMDGRYTTVIVDAGLGDVHMIAAYNAEEGDAVYEIRTAIEALIKAHDGGRLPESPKA